MAWKVRMKKGSGRFYREETSLGRIKKMVLGSRMKVEMGGAGILEKQ